MVWLAIRQFRLQAAVALVALVTLGVLVVVLGTQLLHDYHATVTGCGAATQFAAATDASSTAMTGGTPRSGSSSSSSRACSASSGARRCWRASSRAGPSAWPGRRASRGPDRTLTKLGLLGLASVTAAGVCSLLVTWWASPLDQMGAGPFTTLRPARHRAGGVRPLRILPRRGRRRRHPPHPAGHGGDVGRLRRRPAGRLRVAAAPLHGTADRRSPYRFSGPGLNQVAIGQGSGREGG